MYVYIYVYVYEYVYLYVYVYVHVYACVYGHVYITESCQEWHHHQHQAQIDGAWPLWRRQLSR